MTAPKIDPASLAASLRADQQQRWRQGERILVESYLEQHAALRADEAGILDLLYSEMLLREELGESPRLEEYQQRFPQYASQLRRQLDLHAALGAKSLLAECLLSVNDLPVTLDTKHGPVCESASPQSATVPAIEAAGNEPPRLDLRGYELLERLGGGGMGDVYRAGDPALGRDLAVKVMKADLQGHPSAEQRFLREARVTGSLQHPGIVPIYNLGRLADGRLHYTMRLVRGRTLADILQKEAGRPERLPELLTIFEKVCQAVAYAHSKRVIHRDLKPSNVMVGRFGEVQVMDWGLAKLLTPDERGCVSAPREKDELSTVIHTEAADTPLEQTQMGRELGTPAYMPPEQAWGEWDTVDERADVFALGAILCEILTGQPPYSGRDSMEALRKAKRGDCTEALARLEGCGADAALLGLCRECLAPAREGRPHDAEQVAQRVAAYQAEVQERLRRAELERAAAVVQAREERKRRRWMVAAVLLLLVGAAVSTWQAVRATKAEGQALTAAEAERQAREAEVKQRKQAEEQKRRAEANAQKAEKSEADTKAVLEYFQDTLLSAGRPKGQQGGLGTDVTLRQAVDEAKKSIADSFKDRPLVEASIRDTLGMTYWYLGEAALAIEQHDRALKLRSDKLGPDHPDTLTSRHNLATAYMTDLYLAVGRTAEAIRLHEQTLKQREAKLGTDHPDTLQSRRDLAYAYESAGRTAEAIPLFEQTVKQMEAKLGTDHPDTLESMANLGDAYRDAGRIKDAISLLETALQRGRQRSGGLPPLLFWLPLVLARSYDQAGQLAKAETIYREFLEQRQRQLGTDNPHTADALRLVGANLIKQKKFTDAEPLLRQCLTIRDKKQPDSWYTFRARSVLGEALLGQQKYADAEPLLVQGYQGMKQCQDKIPPSIRQVLLSEALERLVQLYETTDQKDKAAQWRKKLDETKAALKKTKP